MSTKTQDSESEDETVTSSDYSESSDDESSEHDRDDASDTTSYRSLAFSVKKHRSTAIVKSKKSKKRVRFKPGDSLVLIYVIPNREMLGLKSDSESSDYGDSDDDSDDEEDDDDDNDDDDEQEDDDEDDGDDDDDESDEDKDSKHKSKKDKTVKPKPFAKLLAVKQVHRRKFPDLRSNVKKVNESSRTNNLDLGSNQATSKKKQRLKPTKNEKKETPKQSKNEISAINKSKQIKNKKSKTNAIKGDVIKPHKSKRNRSRLLEIRATVEPVSKNQDSSVSGAKLTYKNDIKPNVIDVNGAVSLNNSTSLTNRTRLQPTSFRITKSRPSSGSAKSKNGLPERPAKIAQVVSASYESLTSVLPTSYINLNSIQNKTVDETIKRLDPESMNSSGKKSYAWQVANGTISSQSLRTPSILPFLDSLQNSVSENNTLKLPT
jgi:hypothetical protein